MTRSDKKAEKLTLICATLNLITATFYKHVGRWTDIMALDSFDAKSWHFASEASKLSSLRFSSK